MKNTIHRWGWLRGPRRFHNTFFVLALNVGTSVDFLLNTATKIHYHGIA